MDIDDRTLIISCLSGDKKAFEGLVKRYSPRVFRIVHRFFSDRLLLEDIAQEVFIKAYTSLSTYRQEGLFEHWLSKIAVNTCYHYLRTQRASRITCESDFTVQDISLLEDISLLPFRADTGDPAKRVMLRDLIEKIMLTLSAKEQMILTLSEVEGMSVKEIGALMEMSAVNVKIVKFRARKRALKALNDLSKKDVPQKRMSREKSVQTL
jgi:RNA polymerase sigma-70 factor (ECF subfamily)